MAGICGLNGVHLLWYQRRAIRRQQRHWSSAAEGDSLQQKRPDSSHAEQDGWARNADVLDAPSSRPTVARQRKGMIYKLTIPLFVVLVFFARTCNSLDFALKRQLDRHPETLPQAGRLTTYRSRHARQVYDQPSHLAAGHVQPMTIQSDQAQPAYRPLPKADANVLDYLLQAGRNDHDVGGEQDSRDPRCGDHDKPTERIRSANHLPPQDRQSTADGGFAPVPAARVRRHLLRRAGYTERRADDHNSVPTEPANSAGEARQFLGGFMRMFEMAEWDVIFVKMTRVLVNYFTDMGFKMVFGQTGRSLDSGARASPTESAHRALELLRNLHESLKNRTQAKH